MSWQDILNGLNEVLGALMILTSVRRLYRDKHTRGVHPWHMTYSVWCGLWFTYYYWHLEQWFSLICDVIYFSGVASWAYLSAYYALRERAQAVANADQTGKILQLPRRRSSLRP